MPRMSFQIIDDSRFPHWPAVEIASEAVREALKDKGVTFSISKPYLVDFTNTSEANTQHRARVVIDYPRGQKQAICAAINAAIRPPYYEFTK